jgi:hypothetical protein
MIFMIIPACEEQETGYDYYHIEVMEIDMDCGLNLVKFHREEEKDILIAVYPNAYYPVYCAQNLEEKYRIKGTRLIVFLNKDALKPVVCTFMGPTYSHVYIESASLDHNW